VTSPDLHRDDARYRLRRAALSVLAMLPWWSVGAAGTATRPPAPQGGAAAQPVLAGSLGEPGLRELALPSARHQGPLPLEAALHRRRSLRRYASSGLALADVSQVLWAAQGVTDGQGHRTAPSAGALYPLRLYLLCAPLEGLASGVYLYRPETHRLAPVHAQDVRRDAAAAALGQGWIGEAPVVLAISVRGHVTAARYGARAERFIAMEVGAAAQNLLLQAEALRLGGTLVGAFDEAVLGRIWPLGDDERIWALVPVGPRA
jgi:SagB-type dehydrogenase family enzyme